MADNKFNSVESRLERAKAKVRQDLIDGNLKLRAGDTTSYINKVAFCFSLDDESEIPIKEELNKHIDVLDRQCYDIADKLIKVFVSAINEAADKRLTEAVIVNALRAARERLGFFLVGSDEQG